MLEIKNLSKKFDGVLVLDNISLSLPDSGLVAICGRSGSGKTTLLNLIANRRKMDTGEIRYNGKELSNLSSNKKGKIIRKNMFYNEYHDNLILNLSIKDNFILFLHKSDLKLAYEYLCKFKIENLFNVKLKRLSSGELQKVYLIISLVKKAPITLLDEPICNVDASTSKICMEEIKELSKKSLVLLVVHYEADVEPFFDRKIRITDKKISEYIIRNESNEVETKELKPLGFSFKKSFIVEKSKSRIFLLLFHLIISILSVALFCSSSMKNVNPAVIYREKLTDLSILPYFDLYNASYSQGLNISYDCLSQAPVYSTKLIREQLRTIHYKFDKIGIYDEMIISNEKIKLNDLDIIVPKNITNKTGESFEIGEKLTINNRYFSNLTLNIKYVYDAENLATFRDSKYNIYGVEVYEAIANDFHNTVFMNKTTFNKVFENGANSFIITEGMSILPYSSDSSYNEILSDDEFIADEPYMYNTYHEAPVENQTYPVEFKLGDKSIVREMKYLGHATHASLFGQIVVSKHLFDSLKEELDLDYLSLLENCGYYSIDTSKKSFEDFCENELVYKLFMKDFDIDRVNLYIGRRIHFLNDWEIETYFANINSYNSLGNYLLKVFTVYTVIIIGLYFTFYFRFEIKKYKKIKSEGYNSINALLLSLTFKMVIIALYLCAVIAIGYCLYNHPFIYLK